MHDLRRNLDQFMTLQLPGHVKDKITSGNALKVFPVR